MADISMSRPARGAWIEISSTATPAALGSSRAPHGARGLKFLGQGHLLAQLAGRAPHGARGLKSGLKGPTISARTSRPARGAWIEINSKGGETTMRRSRAPHGARGLKSVLCDAVIVRRHVAPRTGRVD